jgi:transposase
MNPPKEYAALIGLDWADQKHDVCLLVPGQATPEHCVLVNSPEALTAWVQQLRQRFEGRPVAIGLEKTRSGFLHTLMQYDFLELYPLNPTAVARYRRAFSTSRAKDDPTDAALLVDLLAKHRDEFRPWRPDTATTRALAALGEARRQAVNLRTRLSNQLTAALKSYYPQALQLVGAEIASPLARDFLTKWPNLPALQRARTKTVRRFYSAHNCRSTEVIDQRLQVIAHSQALTTDPAVLEPAQLTVQMLVGQLRELAEAIQRYEARQAALFATHADAAIFRSFPGAGPIFAPRLLAAFGTDRTRFESAVNLQQYTGIAPVTERSGNRSWVHWRWACPRFLRQSFQEYANESIRHSLWARAFYESQREKGNSHTAAIRTLAFKWQRIMWRCWQDHQPYSELLYLTMLQKHGSGLSNRIAQIAEKTA